jgi:hypothetical protein
MIAKIFWPKHDYFGINRYDWTFEILLKFVGSEKHMNNNGIFQAEVHAYDFSLSSTNNLISPLHIA